MYLVFKYIMRENNIFQVFFLQKKLPQICGSITNILIPFYQKKKTKQRFVNYGHFRTLLTITLITPRNQHPFFGHTQEYDPYSQYLSDKCYSNTYTTH